METPKHILAIEEQLGVNLSTMFISMPQEFDTFIKSKKLTFIHSESITNAEDGIIKFNLKTYKTQQGFYMYLLFKDESIDLTIYFRQEQLDELTIFIRQLFKQFKLSNKK
jgi:hypothetical protein